MVRYAGGVLVFLALSLLAMNYLKTPSETSIFFQDAIKQEDVDLLYFWNRYLEAPNSSKVEAEKLYMKAMTYRMHVDNSIALIEGLLFGPKMLKFVRPKAEQLVDDDCRRSMVNIFESFCGPLSGPYALHRMQVLENMCDAGIRSDEMAQAAAKACGISANTWRSIVDELNS